MIPNYFNQSYYKNIPTNEVNWAALAQQWIMSKGPPVPGPPVKVENEVEPPIVCFPPPFQPPPSPAAMAGMPPPLMPFLPPMPMSMHPAAAVGGLPSPFFGVPPGSQIPPMPMPVGPPPGYFPPANAFQQNTDNEEYKAYYDRSLEQDDESTQPDQPDEAGKAPAGAMSHWFHNFGSNGSSPPVASTANASQPAVCGAAGKDWIVNSMWPTVPGMPPPHGVMTPHFPIIGTEMRKRLPAWILEGLEKAEREKQKKQQKDEEKKRLASERLAKDARRAAKGKGKFDSDSESDVDSSDAKGSDDRPMLSLQEPRSRSGSVSGWSHEPSPTPIELTPEERKREALLATRRLMTMVLLDATDRQLERIVSDALANAKRKARPKLLANSSALSALSTFGGDDEDDDSVHSDSDVEGGSLTNKVDSAVTESVKAESAKKPKFVQNLATMLRPPTPEAAELPGSSKKLESPKEERRHKESREKSSKSGSRSPDHLRHRSSSHRQSSSSSSSRSSRHESSLSKHHKSSRHSKDNSPLSGSRHHTDSGNGSSSKDRKSNRFSDFSSKRRSDDSPTRHHFLSSSSKKKRY